MRVVPDVAAMTTDGIAKEFDYLVPESWEGDRTKQVQVGTRVRVDLHGRRVGGWVTAIDVEPPPGVDLRPLARHSGLGPDDEVIDLCRWVAWRWAGPLPKLLRSASPTRRITRLPRLNRTELAVQGQASWLDGVFDGAGAVLRIPPAGDRWPVVEAAVARGNPLFIAPSLATVDQLAQRLQRSKVSVARLPEHWARAAAGAAVIGTRTAALATVHDPGCIVVFDEHDEALQEERTPTWHARDIAIERARRLGVPCVLVSPTPSLEALDALPLRTLDRASEFDGWPAITVIDQREQPPGRTTLFSSALIDELRSGRSVACIINRTGRARLLACDTCGEIARCTTCDGAMQQPESDLVCARCDDARPVICQACGATRLKNLRVGVSRAREELAALVDDPIAEATASGVEGDPDARVIVGTEAVLHLRRRFDTVAFCDFDQELSALRQRAGEQAFALLARAARTVGPRRRGGRILVQTRTPDDVVLTAAVRVDPQAVAEAERARREAMRWSPVVVQAAVSGAGAPAWVAEAEQRLGLSIRGPKNDLWLVRADDHRSLADGLRSVPRPAERLRLAVDPTRI